MSDPEAVVLAEVLRHQIPLHFLKVKGKDGHDRRRSPGSSLNLNEKFASRARMEQLMVKVGLVMGKSQH